MAKVKIGSTWYRCTIVATKWHGWRVRVRYNAILDFGWPEFTVTRWVWKWRVGNASKG